MSGGQSSQLKGASGKACGKFILLGEHFVVHGVPALAFPLRGLECEVKLKPNHHFHFKANLTGEKDLATVESLMARATYAAANSFRIDLSGQPLRVESSANFPISRGFGSSASFAVSLVRALDEFRKHIIGEYADWQELVKATSAVEQIFHGRPSGVDASVILAGRAIRFEDGEVVRELKNASVDFVVVDSGGRDGSANLIAEVGQFRERHPEQWNAMAQVLRRLVDECETALGGGDALGVARTVREAHGILSELGLSNPGIEALLDEGRRLGALAGKVSGAGGGGAVLLVANKGEGERVAQGLREAGHSVVGVDLAEGAGLERR